MILNFIGKGLQMPCFCSEGDFNLRENLMKISKIAMVGFVRILVVKTAFGFASTIISLLQKISNKTILVGGFAFVKV